MRRAPRQHDRLCPPPLACEPARPPARPRAHPPASEACTVLALTDVAFVKLGDAWFKMNDSVVICVDEEQVLHAEAFMLFYRKPLLPSTV